MKDIRANVSWGGIEVIEDREIPKVETPKQPKKLTRKVVEGPTVICAKVSWGNIEIR